MTRPLSSVQESILNDDGSLTKFDPSAPLASSVVVAPIAGLAARDGQAALAELIGDINALPTFYTYDFAQDGGAQGTIVLHGPAIPANAFVNAAFLQVITPFTSGGSATVALTTGEAANDIDTAVAFNNGAYSAGVHALSVHKLTTAQRQPAIVIAAADLTAGKIKIMFDISLGWG